jgi:hypothetical protein
VPGWVGATVGGCQGGSAPGCVGARVGGCQGGCVPGCVGARVGGCQGGSVNKKVGTDVHMFALAVAVHTRTLSVSSSQQKLIWSLKTYGILEFAVHKRAGGWGQQTSGH